jgi:hypothetical protein
MREKINVQTLLSVLSGCILASASVVAYAYDHFETKAASHYALERIDKRLDRIEAKIDEMLSSRKAN